MRSLRDKLRREALCKPIYEEIFDIIWNRMSEMGLEVREAQEDMMLNILDAYRDRNNLLVEAGVGIGKSLAYLIPATLISKELKKPCVIATGTIQLTEQLADDIKIVEQLLGCNIEVVIGKGQSNYPCIKRVLGKKIEVMEKYIYLIKENVDKQNPNGIDLKDWDKICVDGCRLSICEHRSDCYYYQIRTKMKVTRPWEPYPKVIIVNQDLLISHFLKEEYDTKGILDQNNTFLIIDEIHNLEEKTRSALTKEIDLKFIEKTFIEYSKVIIRTSKNQDAINLARELEERLKALLIDLFKVLKNKYMKEEKQELERVHIIDGDEGECKICLNKISVASEYLDLAITFNNSMISSIERMYSNVTENLNTINRFLTVYGGNKEEDLIWGNLNCNYKKIKINISPKEIDKVVSRLIFKKNIPTIGLSATITSGLNKEAPYEYIINNIGFIGECDEIRKSPFPYENSRLLIPDNLPNVYDRNTEYYEKIAKIINEITHNVKGGTLVLFTSKEDLNEVGDVLKSLVDSNTNLYFDNNNKSQKEIIKEFKENGGIILGTGVFWEGISLKGDLLTCVIIVRLPFPVPDPVIDYKIEKFKNDNDKVIIPEMITKLKQGSGRLIRSMSDKGILVLLDSRMNDNSYKHRRLILDAIPIKKIITNTKSVEEFFSLE